MNEATVLAEMRDIHLPAGLADAAPLAFTLWPLAGLAVVAGVLVLIRAGLRRCRRRQARAELARIAATDDRSVQWSLLLAFAATRAGRVRHPRPLPRFVYRHPDTVSGPERTAFIEFLHAELGR